MATLAGTQKEIGNLLCSFIELDYDAAAAYEAAIERLEDPTAKAQLGEFLADHRRHVEELIPYAKTFKAEIPQGPDLKEVLTVGKVRIASLIGDKAILRAMLDNEEDTNTAYARIIDREDISVELNKVLESNYEDEWRHRVWFENALGIHGAHAVPLTQRDKESAELSHSSP